MAAFGFLTYNLIDLAINGSGDIGTVLEMFFSNFVIYFFYIVFAIALIIFSKIANKKSVDSIKNKVFAAIPFGIIVIIEITFMIITGATLPEGYIAPGYFVTAVIVLLGAGAIAAIPFLVKFEKEDASGAAKVAPVVAPVAAAPVYQEPQDLEEPQPEPQPVPPQKKNDNNDGGPEVKSNNKKGLIIILVIIALVVLLAGGVTTAIILTNKNNREKGPDDNPSSTVIPPSKSSSSSSSSRSSSRSSSSSSTVSKTPKQVMADIATSIYGSAKYYDDNNEDYNYWYSDSGFITIVAWDLDESYLQDAAEYVVSKLPSYLVSVDSLHSGTWSDGLNGYFQNFVTQDEQVMVEVGSYYDDTGLNCQILSHFNY